MTYTLTPEAIAQRQAAAKSTSRRKAKSSRENGRKSKNGGRPADPRVKALMLERGISRQRAHQILRGKFYR